MLRLVKNQLNKCIWRWGNTTAALGTTTMSDVTKAPRIVPGLSDIPGQVSIANGSDHSAIVADGKLFTYGSNKYHQLGRSAAAFDPTPGATESEVTAVSVTCGGWHTVSLHEDGSVKSFGWGGSVFSGAGALGLGTKSSAERPTTVIRFDYL